MAMFVAMTRSTTFSSRPGGGVRISIPQKEAALTNEALEVDLHLDLVRSLHRAVNGQVHLYQVDRPGDKPLTAARRYVEIMCCPSCRSTWVIDRTPKKKPKVGYWLCKSCNESFEQPLSDGRSVRVKPSGPIPGDPAHGEYFEDNGDDPRWDGPRRAQSSMSRTTRRFLKAAGILLLVGAGVYWATPRFTSGQRKVQGLEPANSDQISHSSTPPATAIAASFSPPSLRPTPHHAPAPSVLMSVSRPLGDQENLWDMAQMISTKSGVKLSIAWKAVMAANSGLTVSQTRAMKPGTIVQEPTIEALQALMHSRQAQHR